MTRRGHLEMPVIGVAKASWTLEQFTARVRESIELHGGVDRGDYRIGHDRNSALLDDRFHHASTLARRRRLRGVPAEGPSNADLRLARAAPFHFLAERCEKVLLIAASAGTA
jgi:hypothetical protein